VPFARGLVLQICLLLITLIVLELTLQIASWSSLTIRRALAPSWEVTAPVVPDPRLGLRGNPLFPGHDRRGYRNEHALDRADIVTLGDSQTHGTSGAHEAWPRLLSLHMHVKVYNMALPGYGPLHSQLQLEEAFALRPGSVVVAPYFGNDLYDAFQLTRLHPEMLADIPPGLRAAADAREREKPLLSRRFSTAVAALTPSQREYASPEDGPEWRTILTPRYRLRALDDRDARIRLGFEAMQASIIRMAEMCRTRKVRFLVILVPTKESVFWPRVKDPNMHPGLREQVSFEQGLRRELMSTLVNKDVEVVDLLDPLRQATRQPFYEDVDGHLNLAGNQVVEGVVAERLRR
jgi:hypothetical protein